MEGNKPFLGRKPIIKLLVSISRVAFFVDVDKAAGSQAGQSTIRQAPRQPGRQADSLRPAASQEIKSRPNPKPTPAPQPHLPPQPVTPLASSNTAGANSGPNQLRPVAHFKIL